MNDVSMSNGRDAAGSLSHKRDLTTFRQEPRLLPEDLSEYVVNRPAAQEGQYDKKLAYALSLISGWSYADHATFVRQLRYNGVDADVTLISCTNEAMLLVATAYFVRSKCGRLGVLSFRGTEPVNLINWLTDTNSVLRPFIYGKVHSGFYSNVEVIWDDISKVLRAAVENAAPGDLVWPVIPVATGPYPNGLQALYVTGHSLGAAMAVVASACLLHEADGARSWDAILRGIYTYGQPMVGDAEFASHCLQQFKGRLFRHVFNDDLVPRLPPRTIHDFVHFGERRFSRDPGDPWNVKGNSTREAAPSLTETLGSAFVSFVFRRVSVPKVVDRILPLPYSIDDHMPTNYIQVSRATLIS
jgi:hypothetical protein